MLTDERWLLKLRVGHVAQTRGRYEFQSTNMSKVREYIFIDERRVRSYFHQLNQGKILRVEKQGSWKTSATTSKLGIERTSTKNFREPTIFEMITDLDKKIPKKHFFKKNIYEGVFERYTFEAQRALILPNDIINAPLINHKYIAVWLPTKYNKLDDIHESLEEAIYLIESSPEEDRATVEIYSAYSLLEFLIYNLKQETLEYRASLLGKHAEKPTQSQFDSFFQNPSKYLESLGAKLSQPKKITTFARVRSTFNDEGFDENHPERVDIVGTIAYPIYIYLE